MPLGVAYGIAAGLLNTSQLGDLEQAITAASTASGAALISALAQDIIPKPMKEWLVFWRLTERLPSYRAFSSIAASNDRIDTSRLSQFSALSEARPSEQHREFYRRYIAMREDPTIKHYSTRYVAWRDCLSMVVLMFFLTIIGALPIFSVIDNRTCLFLLAALSSFFFLFIYLSRMAAQELVIQSLIRMENQN
jgi:hypothetical protein